MHMGTENDVPTNLVHSKKNEKTFINTRTKRNDKSKFYYELDHESKPW